MRIVELKSQSVKIIYKPAVEQIKIGDFISFTDGDVTIIAQVYKILTSDAADDFNQADLLFVLTRQYDIIKQWQGEFVSANAIISPTDQNDIEKYINNSKNKEIFALSKSAQFKELLSFDFLKFITPAFIGFEKREDNFNFVKTLSKVFNKLNKPLIIVDVKGNMNFENTTKVVAGNNVKLPLNAELLENLCNTTLQGISLESKAVIEDVLMELSEYAKNSELGFIPISQLISVINDFYKKSKISPLILLINKLKHYKNMNIFADTQEETSFIYNEIAENKTIIFDLSDITEEWQKVFFANLIKKDEKIKKDFYINIIADESIYDNQTINSLLFKTVKYGIKPIISINYRTSNFDNIFDFCNNAFLFKTNNALKKRSFLTDILQSLPQNIFITKGKLSNGLLLPLIVNEQEEEILDYIEQEISEINDDNTLEEIKEDITEQNLENMDNALREKSNLVFKNPTEYINTPINQMSVFNNTNILQDSEEKEPVIDTAEIQESVIEPIIELQTEEIEEPNIEVNQEPEENILNFENLTIPDVVPAQTEILQEPTEVVNTQETEPEIVSVPQEDPIIENNILQDENIDIPDADDENNNEIINNDEDILDLMESTESNNELDFEEISEEPELENVDVDELDFLNETVPDIMQTNNEDEDLLDLIENKEPMQLDNSLDDIDFIQPPEKDTEDEFEEVSLEEEVSDVNTNTTLQQNASKIPVYNANNYSQQASNNKELNLKEGDIVKHSKYGVGTVKKITSHADKILCHINFDSCGRRLIDPEISQVEKIG